MNYKPNVSIGLPVHNGERYLDETIKLILGQTYPDLELIISDNGSTDATSKICQRFADRDERVRYFRSAENRGAAWNFNRTASSPMASTSNGMATTIPSCPL